MQGTSTSVALISPALVKETLERLSNPRLLKLCLDGTYRLLFVNYALMSWAFLPSSGVPRPRAAPTTCRADPRSTKSASALHMPRTTSATHASPEERASRVSFLVSCLYMSRTMPAHLFHVLWSSLLKRMEVEWASPDVATSFSAQYLCKESDAESLWSARWRAAYDRLLPGSVCGAAPQEAWHR